jgi:hypothetical protein
MTTPDARMAAIAAAQGGAASRRQAHACGVTDAMITHRLRTGRWRRVHPGVYVIAGSPGGWMTTVWSAYLAAGPPAVVSHASALIVHGLSDQLVARHPVTLTVPHGAHSRVRGAVVHQIDDALSHHLQRLRSGLVVSTPPRAVVEVSTTVGHRQLGEVVDEVVAGRITSMARIAACFAEVVRPGKPGMRRLAAVLDERGRAWSRPRVCSSGPCSRRSLGVDCLHLAGRCRCPDGDRSRASSTPPTPTHESCSKPTAAAGTPGCET